MEAILASVVLPAAIDLVKNGLGAIGRKFGAVSVDDQIKLEDAAIRKLEVLAKLDNPNGTPSQWVVDLKSSYRYIAATLLIGVGCFLLTKNDPIASANAVEMIGMPFGFIFGERLYLGFKGNMSK